MPRTRPRRSGPLADSVPRQMRFADRIEPMPIYESSPSCKGVPDGILLPSPVSRAACPSICRPKLAVRRGGRMRWTTAATRILAIRHRNGGLDLQTWASYAWHASPPPHRPPPGAPKTCRQTSAPRRPGTPERQLYTAPMYWARTLTPLFSANCKRPKSPRSTTVYPDFRDEKTAFADECETAAPRRRLWSASSPIHPSQVEIINEKFIRHRAPHRQGQGESCSAAFGGQPRISGVIGIDGEMLDRPHLKARGRACWRGRGSSSTRCLFTPSRLWLEFDRHAMADAWRKRWPHPPVVRRGTPPSFEQAAWFRQGRRRLIRKAAEPRHRLRRNLGADRPPAPGIAAPELHGATTERRSEAGPTRSAPSSSSMTDCPAPVSIRSKKPRKAAGSYRARSSTTSTMRWAPLGVTLVGGFPEKARAD